MCSLAARLFAPLPTTLRSLVPHIPALARKLHRGEAGNSRTVHKQSKTIFCKIAASGKPIRCDSCVESSRETVYRFTDGTEMEITYRAELSSDSHSRIAALSVQAVLLRRDSRTMESIIIQMPDDGDPRKTVFYRDIKQGGIKGIRHLIKIYFQGDLSDLDDDGSVKTLLQPEDLLIGKDPKIVELYFERQREVYLWLLLFFTFHSLD
jgi:hypothetical protein